MTPKGEPPPRVPGFQPVPQLLWVQTSVLPMLREQYLKSLPKPRKPTRRQLKTLIELDDLDDWLTMIVERIESRPAFAVFILDATIVPNPAPTNDRNIFSRHREQSWCSVLRSILIDLLAFLEHDWIKDHELVQESANRIQVILSKFPEIPVYLDGKRI